MDKQVYLKVITELLELLQQPLNSALLTQVYSGAATILENLYGKDSVRINVILDYKKNNFDRAVWDDSLQRAFQENLLGILKAIKADIENNLIYNLEKQITGEIVADFIILAKKACEDGVKDVAVVLGAAALEDSLKRYAGLNGLFATDKDMSEVVNALKSQGLLKGPQASLVSGLVTTRNKAFHAEFDKIEMPEVKSLIVFAEEFILKNLS